MPSECIDQYWNTTEEIWSETELLWNRCLEVITEVVGGKSKGMWQRWKEVKEEEKKKVIKLILIMDGQISVTNEMIKNYEVTINDLKFLRKKYNDYNATGKLTIENLEIK